jgi:hypothetical protein
LKDSNLVEKAKTEPAGKAGGRIEKLIRGNKFSDRIMTTNGATVLEV